MVQPEPRKKALVIAVTKYTHFDPLPFCENDGEKMIEILKELDFDIPESRQLVGPIDHAKMEESIKEFYVGEDVKSTDTLLLYYTGHGTPHGDDEYYFATTETRVDKPFLEGYDYEALTKWSSKSDSTRIVQIIDCCYSGGLGLPKGNAEAQALIGKRTIDNRSNYDGKGKFLLASSMATQQSYGKKDKAYSEFTYHVIQGLKGVSKNTVDIGGHVTPYTLGVYVEEMMADFPQDQRPLKKTEGSDKISLANYEVKYPPVELPESQPIEKTLIPLLKDGNIEKFNDLKRGCVNTVLDLEDFVFPKNVSLKGIDLVDAYLVGCNLDNVDMSGAILNNAKMKNATLINAVLRNAVLDKCDLEGAIMKGADLTGASLRSTVLRNTDLEKAIFIESKELKTADLGGALLHGAKFNGLTLNDVTLNEAMLEGADFSKAKLQNANFRQANLKGALFVGAEMIDAKLNEANLEGTDLSKANLTSAEINGANLCNSTLVETILFKAEMVNADLSFANLNKAKLLNTDLSKSYLIHTNLKETDLNFVNLDKAWIIDCDLNNSIFTKGTLGTATLIRTAFDTNTTYVDTRWADMINDENVTIEVN